MDLEDGAAPAAPIAAIPGSAAKGVAAGLAAAILAFPFTAIAFVICFFMARFLLSKFLHRDVEFWELQEGGTALLAKAVVAGATGLFGAGVAALAALKIFGNAARRPFYTVAGAGFALVAIAAWFWLKRSHPTGLGETSFNLALGWIAALLGMWVAGEMQDEDDKDAAVAAAAAAQP